MSDHAREENELPPTPAERGEARPPEKLVAEIQVQAGALDAVLSVYEGRGVDRFTANVANLRYIHSLLSRAVSALAAPAAQPETETAWQTRAEAAEAELALLREALRRETLIVDNVWGALGISTYAEARGKHIAELVSELRIELASLKAELPRPLRRNRRRTK